MGCELEIGQRYFRHLRICRTSLCGNFYFKARDLPVCVYPFICNGNGLNDFTPVILDAVMFFRPGIPVGRPYGDCRLKRLGRTIVDKYSVILLAGNAV